MNILIGITGGISAYKAIDLISVLKKKGHDVHVIMTDNAKEFCPEAVVNVISDGNLKTETSSQTIHITESKWCDAMIIIPATANTIAKIANGMADNFLTSTVLALSKNKFKIICPAMNTNMYLNEFVQKNLDKLRRNYEWTIIPPVEGLLACGDYGIGKLPDTKTLIDKIITIFDDFKKQFRWNFPLKLTYRGTTNDSYSFLDYDWTKELEIPIYPHVGSFGIRRRHDVHKGIDLYAAEGEKVYSVEMGTIVDICPFTGEIAGFPFWENTYGVYIKGVSGIVVYGEIIPNSELKIGDVVAIDTVIGTVKRVIKNDKGRPISMLHLELHENDIHTEQWELGKDKPSSILDPTERLIKSNKLC